MLLDECFETAAGVDGRVVTLLAVADRLLCPEMSGEKSSRASSCMTCGDKSDKDVLVSSLAVVDGVKAKHAPPPMFLLGLLRFQASLVTPRFLHWMVSIS